MTSGRRRQLHLGPPDVGCRREGTVEVEVTVPAACRRQR